MVTYMCTDISVQEVKREWCITIMILRISCVNINFEDAYIFHDTVHTYVVYAKPTTYVCKYPCMYVRMYLHMCKYVCTCTFKKTIYTALRHRTAYT